MIKWWNQDTSELISITVKKARSEPTNKCIETMLPRVMSTEEDIKLASLDRIKIWQG